MKNNIRCQVVLDKIIIWWDTGTVALNMNTARVQDFMAFIADVEAETQDRLEFLTRECIDPPPKVDRVFSEAFSQIVADAARIGEYL